MAHRIAALLRSLLIEKTDRTEVQVVRSIAAAQMGFLADFAILAGLTEIVGLHYLLSKIVSSVLVFALNFSLRKLLLFHPAV